MLDSIQHLGEKDVSRIIGEVRLLIGSAAISRMAPEDLVEEISNTIGNDVEGPAVWGDDRRVNDLRDVVWHFDAQTITPERAFEDIARICT